MKAVYLRLRRPTREILRNASILKMYFVGVY
jgi:hypothetical protein